ncbi:MAG: PAS domain S-box protein [Edaphobacter sp.]|uniref:two-component system sensor histidine kinase NtrB n=1 Tax=Edaphobacter sp. TaxID=1934404 RepID=UPI0023931B00|nr:PAS domain S-box protein [Edaphobacter sp.]MDE1175277.1 PAS domain S-box protein [Edaphobacter sp.]
MTESMQQGQSDQPASAGTSASQHPPSTEIGIGAGINSHEEASALLAAIVESSDDAIISSTLEGRITSWNKGAEHIFGYSASEMIGHFTSDLGTESAIEDPATVLETIRRGKRVEHYETLRRHKDGSDILVSLTVSPVRDASGKIIGASKVARDITSMRRAEQSLRNADKLALAGRLTASIAHEINNPLEAITNLLFLLQQESLSEVGRHYLNLAQNELMRVSHIASQTLGFFRGAPGPTICQISEIMESAIALHAGRLIVSHVAVETSYQPVPPLLCHQGEMRQVLVNLVTNALDSMPGQGRLLLRIRPGTDTHSVEHGIWFTVADTGVGMSGNTMRQVFEPFYTTKGTTGTGLGLWVTQQIIARHGGHIALRSSQTAERHGTVFSIFLPYGVEASAGWSGDNGKTVPPGGPGSSGEGNSPLPHANAAISPGGESRRRPAAPGPPSAAYTVV